MMFGLSYAKLIGIGVAVLALLLLVADRSRWMRRAHVAEAQAAADCKATRAAANNKRLSCDQTDEQIELLGETIKTLKTAIVVQNMKIDAMGAESERQKADAARASKIAQERARSADSVVDRLMTSSRSGERLANGQTACEASKAVRETWK